MTHAIKKDEIYYDISKILDDVFNNSEIGFDYIAVNDITNYIINILTLFYPDNNKKLLYPEIIRQFVYHYLYTHINENIYDFNYSITNNRDILEKLKIINKTSPAQKTDAWYKYRYERITASDVGSIFEKSPFKKRKDLLMDKCKDIKELTFVSNKFVEHGNKYEICATYFYEYLTNCKIEEFGCLPHNTVPFLGASPDGISEDGIMLEIKCPYSRPIQGIPPIYYWYQIQIQLEVANLPRCDFIECKIVEYSQDDFNVYLKTKNITNCYEVGYIITALDRENRKNIYYYFKYGDSVVNFSAWQEKIINEIMSDSTLDYVKTSYWVIEEYGLCKIYRDTKWYQDNFDIMKKFWDEVIDGRKRGIAKNITPAKRKKSSGQYLMMDSDTESDN